MASETTPAAQPEAPAIPGVARWQKKRVEAEAIRRTAENTEAIRKFAGTGRYMTEPDGTLRILVSSGWRRVEIGWWVGREDRDLFVSTGEGFAYNYERVPEPLVMPADEFAAIKTVRERLEAALDASIIGCPRCKVCDTQIGAAMTVLGPLLERAEAAEAKLAAIREVLTMSLIETGDDLGVLKRPADDSAMLDRALRLIGRLLAVIGSDKDASDG